MFFKKLNDKIKSELENQERKRKIKIIEERKAEIDRSGALRSIINILSVKSYYLNSINNGDGISSDRMKPYIFSTKYKKEYSKVLEIPSGYNGTMSHVEAKLITSIGIKDGNIELYLFKSNSYESYPYNIQIVINDEPIFECYASERKLKWDDLWLERNLNCFTTGNIYNVTSTDWIKSVIKFNKRLKKDNKRVLKEIEEREDGSLERQKKYEDALIKKSKL